MKRLFGAVGLALLLVSLSCIRGQDSKNADGQTDGAAIVTTDAIIAPAAADSARYLFRKTRWGMTQKEVIASEGVRPRLLDSSIMIYATTWRNRQTEITYYFDKGTLGMAEYSVSDPGMRIEDYLDVYNDLRRQLIETIGRPALDDVGGGGFSKKKVGNSFVFKKAPTLWTRLANWELHDRNTEILLYMGYSTGLDDSTKSCDVQFKSDRFKIENLAWESQ